jgi:hypothetical protein
MKIANIHPIIVAKLPLHLYNKTYHVPESKAFSPEEYLEEIESKDFTGRYWQYIKQQDSALRKRLENCLLHLYKSALSYSKDK